MANISSPYGLEPAQLLGYQDYTGGIRTIPLISNVATAFYFGQPVALIAGVVTPIAATPTTTLGVNTPVGVVVGVNYQLPNSGVGYPVQDQYLPANAISAGYTNVSIMVVDDYDIVMRVQADGAVAATNIGKNAPLGNFGGNTTTKKSTINLIAGSIATTNTLGVRILGYAEGSNSGDAFPDLLVKWNFGVHAYQQAAGQ